MKRRDSVTIKEVAQRVSVAQATAARALGCFGRVDPVTRQRVLAAAEELGYHANALARSMVTRTTHTLGLVVADIENVFFARVARAVTDVARQRAYAVLLLNTDEDLTREREAVRVLSEKRVDGLIVVPSSSTEGHISCPCCGAKSPSSYWVAPSCPTPWIRSWSTTSARRAAPCATSQGWGIGGLPWSRRR